MSNEFGIRLDVAAADEESLRKVEEVLGAVLLAAKEKGVVTRYNLRRAETENEEELECSMCYDNSCPWCQEELRQRAQGKEGEW